MLFKNRAENKENDELIKLVSILYSEVRRSEFGKKIRVQNKKDKTENEKAAELLDTLKDTEKFVDGLIRKMERYEKKDRKRFNDKVDDRTKGNNITKFNEHRMREIDLNEMKLQKAKERMNRIVIKGRKVMEHVNPNRNNDKDKLKNVVKKNNDDELMNYY